jgi:hypothetical protein
MNTDLRATADHLFVLADEARERGYVSRASALDRIAEDYEAEIAAQEAQRGALEADVIPGPRPPG